MSPNDAFAAVGEMVLTRIGPIGIGGMEVLDFMVSARGLFVVYVVRTLVPTRGTISIWMPRAEAEALVQAANP